jgi:uncharacterized protein
LVRLVPRDTKFYDLFEEMAKNVLDGATLLHAILADFQNIEARVQQLNDIEHKGDDLTHSVLVKLHQTFITPFDREDIHELATKIDDVLDFLHAAGERLVMYKIASAPPQAVQIAAVIVKQSEEIYKAVLKLDKHDVVLEHCVEINRLENEADRLARTALAGIFDREKDPINLIKQKELIEVLETATDKAEDAANILESVVLKSA